MAGSLGSGGRWGLEHHRQSRKSLVVLELKFKQGNLITKSVFLNPYMLYTKSCTRNWGYNGEEPGGVSALSELWESEKTY